MIDMDRKGNRAAILLVAAACLLAGGCAGTELVAHAVKTIGSPDQDGGTKIGRPYSIDGVTYVPRADPDYDEVGTASWYGADFHGKRTANGEIYDMNALTAAHPTLPMPSRVRVTNLENGRQLVLTVNDRGPFVRGRIIDLSRRSARLLGFERQGTAKVRVQVLDQMVAEAATPPPPREPEPATVGRGFSLIASATAAVPPPPTITPGLRLYVQCGAFADQANAVKLADRLSIFGPTRITAIERRGRILYRVRLGPITSREAASNLLVQVVAAGHREARLVVD